MSNSNGMYNVLNVFKKLLPLNESTAKEVAKDIYESVEAKGSILEGVSKVEQKLREEYETLKTAKGTIHKVGRYGNEYDVGDDGTKKVKHTPKTGQKGRPKKEQPASFDAPKGDIFGRTNGKAPKGKGTVVKGRDTHDTVDEGEVVAVKGGSVHKGHYGYETDVNDDGTKKAKHVPKTGQKGRPKKEQPAAYASLKGDIFGRTTGAVPKSKKGTVVHGKANQDTIDESPELKKAKRRYNHGAKDANADQVGAGKKIDTMKNSLRHKDVVKSASKSVMESVNFRKMMDEADMTMDEMMNSLGQDIQKYKMSGDMSNRLRDFMHLHTHAKKQMEEAGPAPLEIPAVQRKAAGQNFPVTMDQVKAPGDNISDLRNVQAAGGRSPVQELDELAKLAGLTMESKKADKDYDKDGKIESEKDEVIGSRRKAAGLDEAKPDFLDVDKDGNKKEPMKKALKDKDSVDESIAFGDAASDMQDQQGKINVNTNASSDGSKNINISADGQAAEMLLQMLKMAGLGGGSAAAHAQEVIVSGSGEESCDEPVEIEMEAAEDQYANSPEECYQGQDVITHQGDDMNREKKQFKREYPGDNPMAVENIDVVSHMGRDLMAQYQAMKLQK